MSAAVTAESMIMIPSVNTTTTTTESSHAVTSNKVAIQTDVELIKCCCCGLTEECTAAYITMISQRYQGKWICGLCAEAVNYEMRFLNNVEDALIRHMSFCSQFKSAVNPPNPAVHLISAMTHILRRSMSPKKQARLIRSEISVPVLSSLSMLDQNHEINVSEQTRTTEL